MGAQAARLTELASPGGYGQREESDRMALGLGANHGNSESLGLLSLSLFFFLNIFIGV